MYQFFHIEDYSLKQNKQKGRNYGKEKAMQKKAKQQGIEYKDKEENRNNYIRAILNEAMRLKGFCEHITKPELSNLNNVVFGCKLEKIEQICEEYANATRDAKGRKLRADASCLVAGVVSYERSVYELNKTKYSRYKKDVVTYLKDKYKDRLKSVVEHLDEDHPHLHFYVVPNIGEKIEDIHEGKKAIKDLKDLKEKRQAHYKSMSNLQNEFYKQVAKNYGFTRIGAKRQRTNYKTWKQYKQTIAKFGILNNVVEDAVKQGFTKGINDFNETNLIGKIKLQKLLINKELTKNNNELKLKNIDLKQKNDNLNEKGKIFEKRKNEYKAKLQILQPDFFKLKEMYEKRVNEVETLRIKAKQEEEKRKEIEAKELHLKKKYEIEVSNVAELEIKNKKLMKLLEKIYEIAPNIFEQAKQIIKNKFKNTIRG